MEKRPLIKNIWSKKRTLSLFHLQSHGIYYIRDNLRPKECNGDQTTLAPFDSSVPWFWVLN
jgi:hypothetical protein